MLRITHPRSFSAERRYVLDVVFREYLGLDFVAEETEQVATRISVSGCGDLVVADLLFGISEQEWLSPASVPTDALDRCTGAELRAASLPAEEDLPVLFGKRLANGGYFSESEAGLNVGIDLFGSIFFMLTRYEEAVSGHPTDSLGRYRAADSLAGREGFLHRPIADEYIEILWRLLHRLFPALTRKARHYSIQLSHDVDRPWIVHRRGIASVARSVGADLLLRKDPALGFRRIQALVECGRGRLESDPANSFDFLMDQSERLGTKSAFYFIAESHDPKFDANYSLDHPWIAALLRRIHERGHEIGLHPSFHTFRDPARTSREFEILRRACEANGIRQDAWGGRQHYLRWENPTTWQNWQNAGLSYDSSLNFTEKEGFRAGTCHEFPVYNLKARKALALRERPLVVMDANLLGPLGPLKKKSFGEIEKSVSALKERCRKHRGCLTLLWHNNNLASKSEVECYGNLLNLIS